MSNEIKPPNPNNSLLEAILDGTPQDIIDRYARLTEVAATTDFGDYDRNVVVIDTETTGVSFKKDELTQIAAARLEHGEIIEWFVTFVNPGMPIPEDIVRLTNISDDDVADAPTPSEALSQLVEFVGDAKLVAHNAYFDKNFVTRHPSGYPLLENQWIDSLELSRISLPRMKSHRLIDLVVAFGAPLSTHRADDDVVATCALYRILLAAIKSMPESLLVEIGSYADPEEWPFGQIFKSFAEAAEAERVQKASSLNEQAADPFNFNVGTEEVEDVEGSETDAPIELFPSHGLSFSLQAMRRERIVELANSQVSRVDAASLITPAQEDALRNTSITIKGDEGLQPKSMQFPTDFEIEDAFSTEGLLGEIYGDFEQRKPQLDMALAVKGAFEDSTNLVVEAGTGTGKSMAYLVPGVLSAIKNNIGIGVATKTNALLDQLVYKELPSLSDGLQRAGLLDRPLNIASIKGFSHYPCLLKIQRIQKDGPKVRMVANEGKSQAPALAALLSFIEQSDYDDIDSLKIDYRVLPRPSITTNSSECLRKRCPFYGRECFVLGCRSQSESADVVVTNHSLLFYDAVLDNALLPPIRYWVVDEAHSVEEDARKALSLTLSLDGLSWTSHRLTSEDSRTNVLTSALRTAGRADGGAKLIEELVYKAQAAAHQMEEELAVFSSATEALLYFDTQPKSSYDLFDLWIKDQVRSSERFQAVREGACGLSGRMEKVIATLQEIVILLDDIPTATSAQRSLASVVLELKEANQAANEIFMKPSDKYVYSVTLNRHDPKSRTRTGGNTFHAQLYNVGAELNESFYENTRSVVYTSATLTVNNSFKAFESAVGLNQGIQSNARKLKLDPCFDFDTNMQVIVVSDMPEPNNPSYITKLEEFLKELHVQQGGSVLTLFTNKRDMDKCFDGVNNHLKEHGLRLASQRRGVSVKGLRDEFIKEKSLSLFALKSFWEGFDAPGATLQSVVVPRLPFGNPNDPLSMERSSRDDNAWTKFDLPKAVIELRQAAGRLIRKADDRGTFILCDSRLLTKGYGRMFISSLPSSNVKVIPASEVYSELFK